MSHESDDEEALDSLGPPSGRRAPARGRAVPSLIALAVTAVAGGAMVVAFHPRHAGQPIVLGVLGLAYGLVAFATVGWLYRRGELAARLAPRRGDISFGFLLAAALYLVATLVGRSLGPIGSEYSGWLTRVYLQIGDPAFTSTFAVGMGVLAIAAAEELSWRGLVMGQLVAGFGEHRGWLLTSTLYTLVHLPTVFLLADPVAGPNPILLLAAAGCGILWGFLALRIERLGPSLFSHALFTWGVVEYPIWRM